MRFGLRVTRLRALALIALPVVALGGAACMQPDGSLGVPGAPTQSTSASRLPSLLQQLQGTNGAGLEVFNGDQSQVLAAQDVQGKDGTDATVTTTATPTAVNTVAGTRTTGPTARPEASTPTPRPATATPTSASTSTPTPTATASPTATATATATPTSTPTPTATPTGPPSEGTGGGGGTPPHE